ncbi:MAG: hypothetical protein K2L42_00700 [Clostridia bacterium]|nr:hypothetical protein [Clostridia bacterium]
MQSVIGEIYRGERKLGEKIRRSEKYWELCDKADELICEIAEYLGGDMKSVLDELEAVLKEKEKEVTEIYFKEGFKTGIFIGMEISES